MDERSNLTASLQGLVESTTSDFLSLFAVTIILSVASYAFWRYLVPLWAENRRLSDLNNTLKSLTTDNGNPPYKAIRDIVPTIDSGGDETRGGEKRKSRLAGQLKKFEADARDHYLRDLEVTTACPVDYLDIDDVLPADFSWTMVRSMPAVLTTFGIFFTFVGLALGVNELAQDFAAAGVRGDSELLTRGVLGLMSGLGVAFSSSIAGILLAILWGFGERRLTRDIKSEDAVLVERLERLFPSIEESQVWRHMLEVTSDQRNTMKTLAQDVASKIIEGFDATMRPAMDEMKDILGRVADTSGEEMSKTMESMIDKFGNVLGQRLKDQFDNLASTIEELCKWQAQTKENLDAILVKLGETIEKQDEMIEKSSRAAELFQESLGRLGELHQRLSAALAGFHSLSVGMREMGEKLEASREAVEGGLDTIREAVNDLQTFSVEHRQAVTSELDEISSMADSARKSSKEIEEALTGSMKGFQDALTDGLQQTWSEFDKQLAALARSLSGTASGSEETVRELNASVAQVRAQAAEMMESVSQVEERVGALVGDFAGQVGDAVESAMANVNASVSRLDKLMETGQQRLVQPDRLQGE